MEELTKEAASFTEAFLNQETLWFILALFVLIFSIMSLVLVYHWNKFGLRSKPIITAELIYFIGALVIIVGAVVSILLV